MEQMFRIETTLSGELAELYSGLMEEFEQRSEIGLVTMNETIMQTGLIQHLTMMQGIGLLKGEKSDRLRALVDSVAKETIMWELVEVARKYWQESAGTSGAIDLKA